MRWISNIGTEPVEYVDESLRLGLSLSRGLRSRLAGLDLEVYAVVPSDPGHSRLSRLHEGGLGPSVVGVEFAGELKRRFPTDELVVEDRLARPSDEYFTRSTPEGFVFRGEEVYATCILSGPVDSVEKTLRITEPSSGYNAFVLESAGTPVLSPIANSADISHEVEVKAIIVGAYDGEGLIIGLPR